MATLTLIQAVNDALRTAMKNDPNVLVFGEDVGPKGGVFLATEGLTKEFGKERCFDTPLSEDGIIGTAIGGWSPPFSTIDTMRSTRIPAALA